MSMREPDFAGQVALVLKIHNAYPTQGAELTAITTALGSDGTTHGHTIEAPAVALRIGNDKTRFTNDILLLINVAKDGNLTSAQMISGIQDSIGTVHAPTIIDVPHVNAVGAAANVTNGNWTGAPTGYAYQWKRDGGTIAGATAATYTMVGADTGHQIGCVVSATNGQGTTAGPLSNTVAGP